jgi:uncharacterized damage-inducible protein DinB
MATAPTPTVTTEFATSLRDLMLQGLAEEMATTAKVIAAIPDGKRDYKPDPKARTAWELAWHIAAEDVIFVEQIVEGKFAFPDPRYDNQQPKTATELAAWYRTNFSRALDKVRALTPPQLAAPLDFFGMMSLPRVQFLGLVSNHSIHHRGQLSSYLRPMGSKVPKIYGGSADEPFEMPASA